MQLPWCPVLNTINGELFRIAGLAGDLVYSVGAAHMPVCIEVVLPNFLKAMEGDRVLWRRDRDTPYVPSPAIWKDQLIFNKHLSPILTSVKLESGEPVWGPLRLNALRGLFASPVVANGRVYVAAQNGVVAVLDAKTGESLAMNQLEDGFSASPAIVGRTLYLRGDRYLYALRTADE